MPTIKQLSRQTFLTFKKVRELSSPLYGQYQFYSKNGHKFMAKIIDKEYDFVSYRNSQSSVMRYKMQDQYVYLFPINGEAISNFIQKNNSEGQWKRWLYKQGSVEACLWEVVKLLLKLIEEKGLKEILIDCLRVHNGQLEYCYDDWMRSTQLIVLEKHTELQNYFFSPSDLQEIDYISKKSSQWPQQCFSANKNSIYFRVFMLVLQLGTSNLNYRNYEYARYEHNKQHIKERLQYFCSRYNKRGLGDLTRKVIEGQNFQMEELWKVIFPSLGQKRNSRCLSMTSSKAVRTTASIKLKQNKENCSNSKKMTSSLASSTYEQGQSFAKLQRSALGNKDLNISGKQSMSDTKSGSAIKSRSKSYNEPCMLKSGNKGKTYKLFNAAQQFSLKSALIKSKQIPSNCTKILKYLELQEIIPQTKLQQKLLLVLQNVYITSEWVKQIYENGSVYLGQMNNQKKQGKGLYLFNSNDLYYGDWFQNSMNGYGIYIFASGEIYQGQIRKGCKEGHGKCIYEDGRQYEGMWKQNCKVGLGKVKFPNNVTFIGMFTPNKNQTQGLFLGPIGPQQQPLWQNKGILEQYNWQQNQIVDRKTKEQIDLQKKNRLKTCISQYYTEQITTEGATYSGEMMDGSKQGYGIYQTAQERYEGQWRKDKREGKGTLFVKNSFTISGVWKDNILVEYIPSEENYLL